MDQRNLKEFSRRHWEDASHEVSTKLAKWLGRRSRLKEKVNAHTHARTTDNSPWHKLASAAKNGPVVSEMLFKMNCGQTLNDHNSSACNYLIKKCRLSPPWLQMSPRIQMLHVKTLLPSQSNWQKVQIQYITLHRWSWSGSIMVSAFFFRGFYQARFPFQNDLPPQTRGPRWP